MTKITNMENNKKVENDKKRNTIREMHLMKKMEEAVDVDGHPSEDVRARLDLVLQVFQVRA